MVHLITGNTQIGPRHAPVPGHRASQVRLGGVRGPGVSIARREPVRRGRDGGRERLKHR